MANPVKSPFHAPPPGWQPPTQPPTRNASVGKQAGWQAPRGGYYGSPAQQQIQDFGNQLSQGWQQKVTQPVQGIYNQLANVRPQQGGWNPLAFLQNLFNMPQPQQQPQIPFSGNRVQDYLRLFRGW